MHISKLRIRNFRTFGDPAFEIDLKPFTLILGENNIGKTNLITAASLLFSQDISVQQRRSLEVDDINLKTLGNFKNQVADAAIDWADISFPEVTIEATLSGMNDDQHAVVGDWYSNTLFDEAKVTYRFSLRANFDKQRWVGQQREAINGKESLKAKELIDFPLREYRHAVFGGGMPANECDSQYLRMLRVELLDALRDADRELSAGRDQCLLYRVLNRDGDLRYSDLASSLVEVENAVRSNSSLQSLKSDIEQLLTQVSLVTADEDNSIAFNFTAPDATELLKKIGLAYGANPFTVARNGLGRNNLLYIAFVISQIARTEQADTSDDNYVCFRCVGIEEPEAHLHPHLQDHLASNIEQIRQKHSDGLQLLLTSHSTHLAAKLSLENTVVISRLSDGTLRPHYVLDGIDPDKQNESVRFLSLYLDATKSRLLFARSLILVEGIVEQVIVPELFRQKYQRTLESIGCSVVNVNGVAFKHFLTVVSNGLFKRCVVLTDSDAGKATENRADAMKDKYNGDPLIKVCVSSLSTFEKDLIAANANGDEKVTLLAALTATKPNNGPKVKSVFQKKPLDPEVVFAEIENYKAAFAFNFVTELAKRAGKASPPDYIREGFKFIYPEGGDL